MNAYELIETVFQANLATPSLIEGRFYIGYRYGLQEINFDNLGEVLDNFEDKKQYPLSIMAPPHSSAIITDISHQWERYRIKIFFVTSTFYIDSKIKLPNLKTRTSKKTVISEWEDMKKEAFRFLRSLRNNQTNNSFYRLPPNQVLIIPVSNVGMDRVSGIQLNFDFDVFIGCEL